LSYLETERGSIVPGLAARIVTALHNDPANEDPLYLQLARAVRGLIEIGHLRNREALPSERTLAQATGFSRVTVRKAFEELLRDGLISRRAGAGSYVDHQVDQPMSVLVGFTADMRRRGTRGKSILLDKSVGLPRPDELLKLGLSPSDHVVRLSRVRLSNDEALAIEHAVVPLWAIEPDEIGESLYEALRRNGHRPVRALQRLSAAIADTDEAKHLQIAAGSPILHIERHAFLANGRPIEVTRSSYRGDRYDFVAELQIED
jgi:GntR family transcriptional regulator